MKTLFLVRHAKSNRDEVLLSDRERPLAARGQHDAAETGKRLAQRKVQPDLILSSPARRALETAQIIVRKLGYKSEDIIIEDRLYPGQVDELLDVIHALNNKLERVMLFGHNPALVELANYLANTITRMPSLTLPSRPSPGPKSALRQSKV
jgi:phosphohistidine phosphatase